MELVVDASSHGLGAHLVSEGKVTAYTSISLSKTEQKYSQLEKELYAIVFGCKHFHHYLYGQHVEVTTDHRTLEMVVANPIHKAPTPSTEINAPAPALMTLAWSSDQAQKFL